MIIDRVSFIIKLRRNLGFNGDQRLAESLTWCDRPKYARFSRISE